MSELIISYDFIRSEPYFPVQNPADDTIDHTIAQLATLEAGDKFHQEAEAAVRHYRLAHSTIGEALPEEGIRQGFGLYEAIGYVVRPGDPNYDPEASAHAVAMMFRQFCGGVAAFHYSYELKKELSDDLPGIVEIGIRSPQAKVFDVGDVLLGMALARRLELDAMRMSGMIAPTFESEI